MTHSPSPVPPREGGEPMNRYTRPMVPPPCPACRPSGPDPVQVRMLEALLEQNQLLSDLTGAVQLLSAAGLSGRCRE